MVPVSNQKKLQASVDSHKIFMESIIHGNLYVKLPNTKWFTWCGPSKSNKVGWVIDHWGELRIQVREQVLDAADGGDHKLLSSALAKEKQPLEESRHQNWACCVLCIYYKFLLHVLYIYI